VTKKKTSVPASQPRYVVHREVNRRLRDLVRKPFRKSYVTVDDLVEIVQQGADLQVFQLVVGGPSKDVTNDILLDLWRMCEEAKPMFTTDQLSELVRFLDEYPKEVNSKRLARTST
jgi:polyhydroxyalkanoate synthesis regulator protein